LRSTELKDILKEPTGQPSFSNNGEELRASQTILSSIPEEGAVFSQPVTFIAHVIPIHLPGETPTGTVRFEIDQVPVGTESLVNGTAAITISTLATTPLIPHHVMAIYSGNKSYEGSQEISYLKFSIFPANTIPSLISWPNPSLFGQSVDFIVNMSPVEPAVAIPTGSIQFQLDGRYVGTVNLDASGKAIFSSSEMIVGAHTLTAIYKGNENFHGSRADLTHQVSKAHSTTQLTTSEDFSVFGQPAAFTAKVVSEVGKPSGMIQFIVDGVNYGNPIFLNSESQAIITIQNWESGDHKVEAYYLGDERFNPSNAFIIQRVHSAPTKMDLVSSDNPSLYGQSIGVAAKVTSNHLQPIGYIQFKVNGKVYSPPQSLPKNGQVTINISQLKAGSHQIEADYLGSENFSPSNASLIQKINKAKTEISIFSENLSSIHGKPLRLLITVTAKNLIPSGFVQLKLNGEKFGELQPLSKRGQIVIDMSHLDAGVYQIEADYLGNENFEPSDAVITQKIDKANLDTSYRMDSGFQNLGV
jgi:hypothetical protein